jgi:hypothetical protein
VVILAVAVRLAWPYLPDAVTFTRDRTESLTQLHPSGERASSAATGHPASAAFDTYTNRYWAPSGAGSAQGAFVECDFEKPARVRKLVVFNGRSSDQATYLEQARPAALTLVLTSKDGKRSTKAVRLGDRPGQQTFDVTGTDVVRARLTLGAVYGAGRGHGPAIAEIEFYGHL